MFDQLLKSMFGSKHEKDVKRGPPARGRNQPVCRGIRGPFRRRDLAAKTDRVPRPRWPDGETLDDLLPEAFAAVKEACRRLCGQTWDVVGIDVRVGHGARTTCSSSAASCSTEGKIAEMATGEGKTLVATLPLYLNALTGKGAHLVTVNDYLARRDSEWMGRDLQVRSGLTVGCIQNAMDPHAAPRSSTRATSRTAPTTSSASTTCATTWRCAPSTGCSAASRYAIVDEVDSVLIDEARTPLIISGPVEHERSGRSTS